MNSIESLKKRFIVNRKEYEKERLPEYIEKILKFCKIDEDGIVHFENDKLNNTEKIKLVLLARFIANKLNGKIKTTVSLNEIAKSTSLESKRVSARLKEILDGNIASRLSKNSYSIYPYKIDEILDKLINKYNPKR